MAVCMVFGTAKAKAGMEFPEGSQHSFVSFVLAETAELSVVPTLMTLDSKGWTEIQCSQAVQVEIDKLEGMPEQFKLAFNDAVAGIPNVIIFAAGGPQL